MQISDFGLAKWQEYSRTNTNSISQRSTVTHIPPENWRNFNAPHSTKFDVYSFGIMLWELLTEKVPFTHQDGRQGNFCRAMLCISAAYAVMRCLSVCLSRS